jgi:hypothetical protein
LRVDVGLSRMSKSPRSIGRRLCGTRLFGVLIFGGFLLGGAPLTVRDAIWIMTPIRDHCKQYGLPKIATLILIGKVVLVGLIQPCASPAADLRAGFAVLDAGV